MRTYIAIALAMLLMAIPCSAYDQTYTYDKSDFILTNGEGIPCDFTLTLSPTSDGKDLRFDLYSSEQYLEGYFTMYLSPDPNIDIKVQDIRFFHTFNGGETLNGNNLLYFSPHFANNKPVYVKAILNIDHTNIDNYTLTHGTYTLHTSCLLGANVIPISDSQNSTFPIDAYVDSTSPIIESISIEQYHDHISYNERHALHFTFSDLNGYDDISSIHLLIHENGAPYDIFNAPINPTIIPINVTHASASFGVIEILPSNNSITLTLTDSSGLSTSETIYHTPKNWGEPVSQPPFSIDSISFPVIKPGSNATSDLIIRNHNGPSVTMSYLSFNDFTLVSGTSTIGEIQALNLKYSIPTTTLSGGESLCIPLNLYIPLGTKAGYIFTSGRIELTTLE
ncbi:MAG: hypothetical protein Q8J68_06840 [Methanolobus sp.]|uniref:hypothetical protein n=1 Tax=Methanolobus sp. TaxID=1874737 RepID=UPI002730B8EF|nr:hypothetical protein [Methanolobus sp.]MDP2216979.1 hypothetical protein [Methanolobus sp.]